MLTTATADMQPRPFRPVPLPIEKVEPERLELTDIVCEVGYSYSFIARRKKLATTITGCAKPVYVVADYAALVNALNSVLFDAFVSAPSGARVAVELARSSDRIAIDVVVPSWSPTLPPQAPAGSGIAVSVLRTATGARVVISMPAAALS